MASLFTSGKFQAIDISGPLSGGKVYTWAAGGLVTPLATYTTQALDVPNANPVILDSAGRASIWLGGATYRIVVKTSADVVVYDEDNIIGNESDITPRLASAVLATDGAGMVGFGPTILYGANTVGGAVSDMYGKRNFNLYVSVTGSDAADGLTVGTPFATLQKAFDTLMAIGSVGGTRIINIAAGTYNGASNRVARLGAANEDESSPNVDTYNSNNVSSINFITIQGPDVGYDPASNPWPTPTAIFDGLGNAEVGIQLEGGGVKVLVKNIKFSNYSGSSSSAGITNDGGSLRTENVHTSGCTYGIQSYKGSLEVRGGDFYGTAGKVGVGIRSLFKQYHSIGNQAAVGAMQGPRFRFLDTGAHAQEGAFGHADSCLFEDCVTGLHATVNARFNYSYSNFKRCTRAVRVAANSVVYGTLTATFNQGTADANDECVWIASGGLDIDRDNYNMQGSVTADIPISPIPVWVTGSTSSIVVLSQSLPYYWYTPDTVYSTRHKMRIKVHASGDLVGSAGSKYFKLRLGASSTVSVTVASTENGSWVLDGVLTMHAAVVQTMSLQFNCHLGSKLVYVNTNAVNEDLSTGTAKTLGFEVQLNNAADTVLVNECYFELWG